MSSKKKLKKGRVKVSPIIASDWFMIIQPSLISFFNGKWAIMHGRRITPKVAVILAMLLQYIHEQMEIEGKSMDGNLWAKVDIKILSERLYWGHNVMSQPYDRGIKKYLKWLKMSGLIVMRNDNFMRVDYEELERQITNKDIMSEEEARRWLKWSPYIWNKYKKRMESEIEIKAGRKVWSHKLTKILSNYKKQVRWRAKRKRLKKATEARHKIWLEKMKEKYKWLHED